MSQERSTTDGGDVREQRRRQFIQLAGAGGIAGMSALAGCSGGKSTSNGGETSTGGGGSGGSTTQAETPTSTPTSDKLGGQLVAGTQADVVKLDPHATTAYSSLEVLENVYQKLTALNPKLKPEGQLAKDWTISDDGKTWTFKLHEGVKFHPPVSREMTADDVVYSINRILDPDTGSPRKSNFEPIKKMTAKDDYTVVFEFDEPYAPFLYKLTTSYVMPKGAGKASDYDITKQPVGTGPFTFKKHVSQSYTLIEAFDDYWEKDDSGNQLPYLDSVKFKPVPEGSSRVTNLKTGELDWIDSAPRSQSKSLSNASSVHFSHLPGTWYDYIGKNVEKKPLDDPKLRKAINYAIDRESIVKGARFGFGEVTHDPVPPASVWKDLINASNPYEQDKEKAKSLVDESSYDGEKLEIMVGQQYKGQVNEATIAQKQLSDIGLKVEVSPTEWGTMISKLNKGDFQMTIVGWIGFVDPDSMFYNVFHTGEKFNQVNYSNDKVDSLLEKGRHVTDSREARAKPYNQAMDVINQDAPYAFLLFNDEIMAWKPYVKGFTHYATGTVRFKSTWKASSN